MAKLGRHKKEILETVDLESWRKFQKALATVAKQCCNVITPSGMSFTDEFLVNDSDDIWTKTVKALKFKHYVLGKDLTQEECTYFIGTDDSDTAPSSDKHLTKMTICKIEKRACEKLRAVLRKRYNISELGDVCDVAKHRQSVEELTLDNGPNTGLSQGEKWFLK